ncbi:MAG TPA: MFS transporter [Cytophagales bacterium]|jgi:FSR family fosmidomycin resistance protein-like MFS transporter
MKTTLATPSVAPLVVPVLAGISVSHLLNDTMQSVIPALFPILEQTMHLSYSQLGLVAFANNITASLLQPLIGWYTDRKPLPFLLPVGMFCTLLGMGVLAFAPNLPFVIMAVMLVGLGSAVFHPEGSRLVISSAGSRPGLAQSIFQVGGNSGQALAPLLTLLFFARQGQAGAVWFVGMAALAMLILYRLSLWHRGHLERQAQRGTADAVRTSAAPRRAVALALAVILLITFARSWYVAGITNFYALFQIKTFGASLSAAQAHVFVFLVAGALGTLVGGGLGDRFGKKKMLIFSSAACAPFSWLLTFSPEPWTYVLLAVTGFSILTGFSVALIYTLELLPGKTGTVSGLLFGLAFGLGAIGSMVLGWLGDRIGLPDMLMWCSLIPLIGLLAFALPPDDKLRAWSRPPGAS